MKSKSTKVPAQAEGEAPGSPTRRYADTFPPDADQGIQPRKGGQMEEVAVWWWGDAKKVIEPSRLQIQTSAAPASKYKGKDEDLDGGAMGDLAINA